jgi:hypothetical protein
MIIPIKIKNAQPGRYNAKASIRKAKNMKSPAAIGITPEFFNKIKKNAKRALAKISQTLGLLKLLTNCLKNNDIESQNDT